MAKEDKKIDFESSLKELESIVDKLEDENINLEDSVKSFEKGINLVKECQEQLQTAELKIKKLLDDGSSKDISKSYLKCYKTFYLKQGIRSPKILKSLLANRT